MIIYVATPSGSSRQDEVFFDVKETYYIDDDLKIVHTGEFTHTVPGHNGEKSIIVDSYDDGEVYVKRKQDE